MQTAIISKLTHKSIRGINSPSVGWTLAPELEWNVVMYHDARQLFLARAAALRKQRGNEAVGQRAGELELNEILAAWCRHGVQISDTQVNYIESELMIARESLPDEAAVIRVEQLALLINGFGAAAAAQT